MLKRKFRWNCLICTFIFVLLIPTRVFANNETNLENILEEQVKSFGIQDFLQETKKYTEDLDVSNIFNNALNGRVDNKKILSKILRLLGKDINNNLKNLLNILLVVLIHSILKAFTDGLENNNVSKIVYYVQYILIVIIIMTSFSDILKNINVTIENLVGFVGVLIPILITLMIYTGSIATSTLIEPILLFLIEFISLLIKKIMLPVVSIITAIVIISKITDKIQISSLSKFMKSSIVWTLGVFLTVFIGVLSLEGTLTSSVDGITAKTTKAAVSSLIPVVRQSFRRWCRCYFRCWSCNKKFRRNSWCSCYNWNLYYSNYKAWNL